jgi:hypothetical protein
MQKTFACLHPGSAGDFPKHVLNSDQVIVEELSSDIQEPEERGVRDGIENIVPDLATQNNIADTQYGELLRDISWFYLQEVAEFVHTLFPVSQRIENANPDRVGQGLEELSLENRQLVWHSGHGICAYSNLDTCECQVQSWTDLF